MNDRNGYIRRRAKLADVAKLAEVSYATVSRVLNTPEIVSPELRERVRRAITELSYHQDERARSLKSGKSRAMGAVVPTLGVGIFADGVEALQNRLSELGYSLLLANSQYNQQKELQEVQALLSHGINGLVLVGDAALVDVYEAVRIYGVPCVLTYVCQSSHGLPAVGIDNFSAGGDLAQHLLRMGHHQFGIIANMGTPNDRAQARLDGAKTTLGQVGIQLPPGRIISVPHSLANVANGRMALRQLLARNPEITAVLCTTDTLAIGALAECRSLGLVAPRDISVTGFDDIELASQIDPPLTTVKVPAAEFGRLAADYLTAAVAGSSVQPSVQLPATLVVRGSTGPVPTTRRSRRAAQALA